MSKIVYINKATGEEVNYGDEITVKERRTLSNGYRMVSTSSFPVINETIPFLIEKDLLVQKEIKDEQEEQTESENLSIEDKLDLLAYSFANILTKVEEIEKLLHKNKRM